MTKMVLFDNDGVLVNTEHYYFVATRQVMAEYNFELTPAKYLEHYLVNNTGLFDALDVVRRGQVRTEDLRRERDQLFLNYLTTAEIEVPGVEEMLSKLKFQKVAGEQGVRTVGVVTSSQREHFEVIHSRTGYAQYFDFVLTREDYERSKPDPEPYQLALGRSGVNPEDVLVIEDSPRGVTAAHGAGLKCWVVPSELTVGYKFPDSVRMIESWDEVVEWGLS